MASKYGRYSDSELHEELEAVERSHEELAEELEVNPGDDALEAEKRYALETIYCLREEIDRRYTY